MSRKMVSRGTFTAALILALVAGSTCCRASAHDETLTRNLLADDINTVVVKNASGAITIIGEQDKKDIYLRAEKQVKSDDKEESAEIAALMEIEVTRSGDVLLIESKYPKKGRLKKGLLSFLLGRYPKMSMTIYLNVPSRLGAEVVSASGNVSVSELSGRVQITAASGNVDVKDVMNSIVVDVASGVIKALDIGGEAKLSSSSGQIYARNIAGDAVVGGVSGDIELAGIEGDLDCKLSSGNAVVDGVGAVKFDGTSGASRFSGVRGAVEASVASGDLSFRVVPDGDVDYTLTASSGNISLRFIKIMEGGFALKAGTTSGKITANLPIDLSSVSRNRITGIVRGGKSKVFLETASGNVHIEEPEE